MSAAEAACYTASNVPGIRIPPIVSSPAYRPPLRAARRVRWSCALLDCFRWRIVLAQPVPPKCVAVFYPHTSNWDFVIGILAKWTVGLDVRWVAKDSLFVGPFGRLLRSWGGIPVNRRERTGFTERLARECERHHEFRVVIAPEGTRGRAEHWKSGFYHLALRAGLPVALAYADYPRREVGIGAYLDLTGDAAIDMQRMLAFYAGKAGRRPALQGPIRLRDAGPPTM